VEESGEEEDRDEDEELREDMTNLSR